ncbi:MAG: trehalose-6-phosphate synthase [Psychrobacter glacincola]
MSRLIVLSNRVKIPDGNPMAGGLAIALQDVLNGKSVVWMGWNGEIVERYNDGYSNEFSSIKQTALADADAPCANTFITYMTTALTTEQYQQFYCGFANNVLWPLLHERVDLISQAPEDYAGYQTVNHLFAKQLKKIIEPDDVIWVHDYHFLSVAYHCRQLGVRNRIGFFFHIPFVSLPFWQSLDKSGELIRHLAHYDVLGTQTQQGRANCFAVCHYYLKDSLINVLYDPQGFSTSTQSKNTQIMLNLGLNHPHYLRIDAYPIGINVTRIQQQISHLSLQYDKANQNKKTIKSAVQKIIAVDRIDYSKGLLKRFSAYRDFLQQNPLYQNQLTLLQIACPSRLNVPAYQRLYDDVKYTINDINQQFLLSKCRNDISENEKTMGSWQAINYCESVISHQTLMTLFWQSDIGWVNSLKDGMNLVAKEYIAAQNPDNPGVLLLSRYAGAAEQMQAALIIDPHKPKSMTEGLSIALTMPLSERQSRYQSLLKGLQQDNLQAWQQRFLEDLYDGKKRQTDNLKPAAVQMSDS